MDPHFESFFDIIGTLVYGIYGFGVMASVVT